MKIVTFITFSLLLITIIIYISQNSTAAVVPNNTARSKIRGSKVSASGTNKKTPEKSNRVDQKRDCGEMSFRSGCGQNPMCRWCRSVALDDMCFSKFEAWRLPSQVFSCEF